ncbi:gamma-coixin [Panicum miliaceum]|uniref:Gamma-coixin n=1 Tax=Panicum miliaceum TaxID=4540 RepID=A0A3L6TCV8_PANMI|nr:gamma-coixin [Panicum miliaceum]
MKEMIAILAFMALIASAASMQMGPCSCGQQQGHEQHIQQQHHPQQQQQQHQHQQQQHHQQQHVHVQQRQHHQQQKVHFQQQPQKEHHEQPQQQHHQQYQDQVQQQPPQHQYYQQCHEQPLLQQQPCQYGYEQKPNQQGYSGSQNLNNCRELLREQCNPLAMPFLQSRLLPPSSCQILRQQCCQELRKIKPGYLHQAINSMVQSFTHHQQEEEEEKQQPYGLYGPHHASQSEVAILMAAQYLPSMCGLYHSCGQNNPCHNKDASGPHN